MVDQAKAREKLELLVKEGQAKAQEVIQKVQNEQPADIIASDKAMDFFDSAHGDVCLGIKGKSMTIHDHALGQVAERADVPLSYVRTLQGREEWGRHLLAHNFNEFYRRSNARHLVRSVSHQVRGFLSDRYRRLDSRPIVEAFASACAKIGAVPIEGYALDTKIALHAIVPKVMAPFGDEHMVIGVTLQNSDYGDGALSIQMVAMRIMCANLAVVKQAVRTVHIGGRLSEDIAFSQKTYDLDTRAMASATTDTVKGLLAPAQRDALLEGIRRANQTDITGNQAMTILRQHLDKPEAVRVAEAYNSPDVEMLPPGQNLWRLSNAISWAGGKLENRRKALEYQAVAGEVIRSAA